MTSLRFLTLVVLPGFLALAPGRAAAERATYALDPVHTRVAFSVGHAGFSSAIGTVSGSTGTLEFDPDDWRSARVVASVPLARLELGDARWNASTLDLLDVENHPVALFVSTRVEPVDDARATAYGTLTLHGVSREVALDLRFNQLRRHPLPPFRRTVGFSATTVIDRRDFGIDDWPSVIGHAVEIRIEAEAVRSRGSLDAAIDDEPLQEPEPAQAPIEMPESGDEREPAAPDPASQADPAARP